MKKQLLLCFAAALLLAGCGGSSAAADEAAAQDRSGSTTSISETSADISSDSSQTVSTTAATISGVQQEGSAAVAGMNYFVFNQETITHTDEAGRQLMIQQLTIPDFSSSTDPELESWVDGILNGIYVSDVQFCSDLLTYAKRDMEKAGESSFYAYSNYVSMGIGRHDSVASVLYLSSTYSGGAHPNSVQTAYNLDLNNRKVLTLEDVIYEESAPSLAQLVLSAVESKFASLGEGVLFEDYTQTISNAFVYGSMTPYWYFNDDGLVIFFNQYELGPYSTGIVKAQLSYDQLGGILREDYLPVQYSGTLTDISLQTKPSDGEWVYYVDLGEGDTFYISIEGRASHVQLSEVKYVEQTPVGENMLYSASYLDDTTTIGLTIDLHDDSKVYAIEYFDQNGGPYMIYLQGMKITTEFP